MQKVTLDPHYKNAGSGQLDDPENKNWSFNISKKSVMNAWDKAYKNKSIAGVR